MSKYCFMPAWTVLAVFGGIYSVSQRETLRYIWVRTEGKDVSLSHWIVKRWTRWLSSQSFSGAWLFMGDSLHGLQLSPVLPVITISQKVELCKTRHGGLLHWKSCPWYLLVRAKRLNSHLVNQVLLAVLSSGYHFGLHFAWSCLLSEVIFFTVLPH